MYEMLKHVKAIRNIHTTTTTTTYLYQVYLQFFCNTTHNLIFCFQRAPFQTLKREEIDCWNSLFLVMVEMDMGSIQIVNFHREEKPPPGSMYHSFQTFLN